MINGTPWTCTKAQGKAKCFQSAHGLKFINRTQLQIASGHGHSQELGSCSSRDHNFKLPVSKEIGQKQSPSSSYKAAGHVIALLFASLLRIRIKYASKSSRSMGGVEGMKLNKLRGARTHHVSQKYVCVFFSVSSSLKRILLRFCLWRCLLGGMSWRSTEPKEWEIDAREGREGKILCMILALHTDIKACFLVSENML